MSVKYSTRLIKDIGKQSTDGICIYDMQNKSFTYANKSFRKILETSKERLKVESHEFVEALVATDRERLEIHVADFQASGKIQNVEFRLKFKSKEKIVAIDAFVINGGDQVVAIIRDVTSAKQHFNYIVEFGARKDALLDLIAHNLSAPLNLTTDLLNVIDQLNKSLHYKKIDHHTRLIRESTQQCIEIINSFLKEEHYESENIFAKRNLFDAVQKVKIVVDRFKELNADKDIRIVTDKRELLVSLDDVKFFQVVHNLVSNAVKFTPSHGRITVTINDYERLFEVSVSDTGIGIPEHLQPYIFQKNTPASREGIKGEKSIGMGLYIIDKLTAIMGGKISFTTEENAGSTFQIRLPKD